MWMMPERVTVVTGLSRDQLRGMCRRGLLERGVHWAVIDRKLLYNEEAIQAWLDTQASAQQAEGLRLDFKCEDVSSRISSPPRRPKQRYRMQLASAVN